MYLTSVLKQKFSTSIIILLTIHFVQCKLKYSSNLGQSSQLFTANLYAQLEEGNRLISPILLQSTLSSLPTIGLTKTQIIETLHVPHDDVERSDSFQKYITSLFRSKGAEIHSPSVIYVKNNIRLSSKFKKSAIKYGTELRSADFSKPKEAAHKINEWTKMKTNNKITNIVDESTITPQTAVMLISALYFRGNWKLPFVEEATYERKFYSNGKIEQETPMMYQMNDFHYYEDEDLDAKYLEMLYENENYKMTIVLPNKRNGLPELEKNISRVFQERPMTLSKVSLTLPKFKFENTIELNEILKKLGLTSIFEDGISFNNFARKMKINNIIQKVFIDVNEIGTEAAGVMEVDMSSRFGIPNIKMFNADHPFLFYISQQSSGVILFVGKFTEPVKKTT